MYKTILKNSAVIVIAAALALTSCKSKKDTVTPTLTSADDNGGYASDAAKLDQNSNDVISIADVAGTSGGSNLRTTATTLGGCATVTNDTISTPHLLTIDFGTTACTCADGKTRSGKILVSYSGRYKDAGSTHTITTSNYYVNGLKTMVHKTVTNEGMNTSSQYWYTVTVNDTIVLGVDSMISWTGSRTRTWFAGYGTTDRSDDVYLIGGTTVLRRANGNVFTHTISSTNPLKVALACRWIESGSETISSTSFAGGDRVLDFSRGGGGCDALATVTIGTHTYDITLH